MTKIKYLRRRFNLSEHYVANYLDLSLISYSQIESGKLKPNPQQAKSLEKLYGTKDLFGDYHLLTDSEKIKALKNFLLTNRV